jgi:hypothetical protein
VAPQCASVSPSMRCVSAIVRHRPDSVSSNVRLKAAFITRRAGHHCEPLHLGIFGDGARVGIEYDGEAVIGADAECCRAERRRVCGCGGSGGERVTIRGVAARSFVKLFNLRRGDVLCEEGARVTAE